MWEKILVIEKKYLEINNLLHQPEVYQDTKRLKELSRQRSGLEDVYQFILKYKKLYLQIEDDRRVIKEGTDSELIDLAKEELEDLTRQLAELAEQIKIQLLPQDPNDQKDVILEIRAGTGGGEAALFAGDLYRMYSRYCERLNWKKEIIDANPTELGGFREIVFSITGDRVYSRLKYESGVHRVQRVPVTESGGRIHTSAATVAVMAEADDIDVEIDPQDLKIDVYRSTGSGGQHVNTTDSAVRITHLSSGLVVQCQDEKSQIKNRAKAMKVLRARLYDKLISEQQEKISQERKTMIGGGDRSEKIRTYNYPQNRLTDHRINFTTHQLEAVLDGALDELIDTLVFYDQTERLKTLQ